MPVTIIPQSKQAPGQFNGGAILEKRPVIAMRGYPQLKPYSNLFYWARAWSDNGSTIGEHPHQAFEIMSFVIKGAIEHYDSKNKSWITLNEGDAQVIRAGNGISHMEKITAGSTMFQIWLDPHVDKAIMKPASYDDYASAKFPVTEKDGEKIKTYHGSGAPMRLDSEGVAICELWLKTGKHTLNLDKAGIHSIFLIDGNAKIGEGTIESGDFFMVKDESSVELDVSNSARLFHIQTPANVSYPTYASRID
jgi:hypothetical protein